MKIAVCIVAGLAFTAIFTYGGFKVGYACGYEQGHTDFYNYVSQLLHVS